MVERWRPARRLAVFLGGVLTLVCVAFFATRLTAVLSAMPAGTVVTFPEWILVAVLAPAYAVTLALLASAWATLVGGRGLSFPRLVDIYAMAQFGKYLPGNVLHLVGRHAVLRREGYSHIFLVKALLAENGLLVIAALSVGVGLSLLAPATALVDLVSSVVSFAVEMRWLASALVLVLAAAGLTILGRLTGTPVWRASPLVLLFFLAQSALFSALLAMRTGDLVPAAFGAVALSWIVGFVTPGSPGGIGIREIVMLTMLGDTLAADDLVVTVALYRLVTFAGDAIMFGFGFIRQRSH
ncbi:conserved membrane hypothetical protein [uncultured Pleomorphomonas sp.]|uniref:Transmembrane protein n=1 Tax=uncultured Pleomorphomonas sp. TaxID=442121 RepID=A0A212LJ43_9HYPH|nr:hypothetical protein [uncultured Pleomorphomonas sp.]SCM77389.1 conserved membrane hypothetical protein [uncultured Pleomorphomonas sp.]